MNLDGMSDRKNTNRAALMWTVAKWSLCLVVLGFVAVRARQLVLDSHWDQLHIEPLWLLLAGIVYSLGWLPSVWFWHTLLKSLGQNVSLSDTARSYYCGHLGKYIPGKATVLVIRGGMLKDRGASFGIAAVTAAYETLVMMGTGLACGIALLPLLIRPEQLQRLPGWLAVTVSRPAATIVAMLALAVIGIPIASHLLNLIAQKMSPTVEGTDRATVRPRFLAAGLVVFVLSWSILALSLLCVLRGLGADSVSLVDWPRCLGAVSLATSAGFIAIFAPGGVGVREGLLIELTQTIPGVDATLIVAAAVTLRLVWLAAELSVGGVLYWRGRTPPLDG